MLRYPHKVCYIFFPGSIDTIYSDTLSALAIAAKWRLAAPILLVAGAVDMAGGGA